MDSTNNTDGITRTTAQAGSLTLTVWPDEPLDEHQRYGYRILDNQGRDLVLPGAVELFRDITYADSDVLAKTQEEDLLWRDMESDLVQQLLRRLSTAKPTKPVDPE